MNAKKEGANFWDANPCGGQWTSFQAKMDWVLGTESYVYELVDDGLLKDKSVLEVGCGQGMVLALIATRTKAVVGLDISFNSLQEARKGLQEVGISNVALVQGDAEKLPFSQDQFDVVYSLGVLHHTLDTQEGIRQIYGVLKPTGQVIIMLYKKYNPKWLAVILFRFFSRLIDLVTGQKYCICRKLKQRYVVGNSDHGTALLELFGCPILKMFSRREAETMFSQFRSVEIECYQSGFGRLFDFLPGFLKGTFVYKLTQKFDEMSKDRLGFYMVIRGKK